MADLYESIEMVMRQAGEILLSAHLEKDQCNPETNLSKQFGKSIKYI